MLSVCVAKMYAKATKYSVVVSTATLNWPGHVIVVLGEFIICDLGLIDGSVCVVYVNWYDLDYDDALHKAAMLR